MVPSLGGPNSALRNDGTSVPRRRLWREKQELCACSPQVDRGVHVAAGSVGETLQERVQSRGSLQRGGALGRLALPLPRKVPSAFLGV